MHYLSTTNSHLSADESLVQVSPEGILDVTHSSSKAGKEIVRHAQFDIHHREATSSAARHALQSLFFDNQSGTITTTKQGESSFLSTSYLSTDSKSRLEGQGDFFVTGVRGYHGQGTVKLQGHYGVEGEWDMILDHSVEAKGASFKTTGTLTNLASIRVEEYGALTGSRIYNHHAIFSQGDLLLNQQHYQTVRGVEAKENLALASRGPIHLNETPFPINGLSLISDSYVQTNVPLHLSKDFAVSGSRIEIKAPVHARKGIFSSTGLLHFNHTYANFNQGIEAQVDKFFSDVSTIDMSGRSVIKCREFVLGSEVKVLTPRKFLWFTFPRTSQPYAHTPSVMRQNGELNIEASEKAVNDASTLEVSGDLNVIGGNLEHKNRTHIHTVEKKVGKVKKKKWGFIPCGSTSVYEHEQHTIIDGEAITKVGRQFTAHLSGTFANDGGVRANKMLVTAHRLRNGIFDGQGRTPLSTRSGFKPGGDLQASQGIVMNIQEAHNRGFIEGGKLVQFEGGSLINEQRLTTNERDVVKIRSWGRHKKGRVPVDHANGGGQVTGDILVARINYGSNQGGMIGGREFSEITGGHFDNLAQTIRSVVDLSGSPLPWNTKEAYGKRQTFMGAVVNSGGPLRIILEGRLRNIASDIIGMGDTLVQVRELIQQTLFAINLAVHKPGMFRSKTLYDITKRDGSLRSLAANLKVVATHGDIDVEGLIGAHAGDVDIEASKGNVILRARTVSADNKIKQVTFKVPSVTFTTTHFDTHETSLPILLAGGNTRIKAPQGKVSLEELQAHIHGNMRVEAETIETPQHVVESYRSTEGFSIGLDFFGSNAIKAATEGKGLGKTMEAVLREDPAINSLYTLASTEGGMQQVTQAVMTAAHVWNETAMLSKAINNGNVSEALGEQLGLTRVGVRLGVFENEMNQVSVFPPNFFVGGNLHFEADEQHHSLKIEMGGDATLIAKKASWSAKQSSITQDGSEFGLSVAFSSGGIDLGMDVSMSSFDQLNHHYAGITAGKRLKIKIDHLDMRGARLEGEDVEADIGVLHIETPVDTQSSNHFAASASTTGAFNVAASQSEKREIGADGVAGIIARRAGSLKAHEISLTGAALQNIHYKTDHLYTQDLHLENTQSSFSVSGNAAQIAKALQGNSTTGFTILGSGSYSSSSQKTTVHALSGDIDQGKKHKNQFSMVAVSFDRDKIQTDLGAMREALSVRKEMNISGMLAFHDTRPSFTYEEDSYPTLVELKEKPKKPKQPIAKPEVAEYEILESVRENQDKIVTPLVFSPDLSPSEAIALNVVRDTKRAKHAVVKGASDTIDFTNEVVGEAILWGARKICHLHPKIHQVCHTSKEVLKETPQFIAKHTPEVVKEGFRTTFDYAVPVAKKLWPHLFDAQHIQKQAEWDEKVFGISQESTHAYPKHILNIGANITATVVGGKVLSVVGKGVSFTGKTVVKGTVKGAKLLHQGTKSLKVPQVIKKPFDRVSVKIKDLVTKITDPYSKYPTQEKVSLSFPIKAVGSEPRYTSLRFDYAKKGKEIADIYVHSLVVGGRSFGSNTSTHGALFHAMHTIKEFAATRGIKKIQLSFDVGNRRLLDVFKKRYNYIKHECVYDSYGNMKIVPAFAIEVAPKSLWKTLPFNLKAVEAAYNQAKTKIAHQVLPAVKNQSELKLKAIKQASQVAINTLVQSVKKPLESASLKTRILHYHLKPHFSFLRYKLFKSETKFFKFHVKGEGNTFKVAEMEIDFEKRWGRANIFGRRSIY